VSRSTEVCAELAKIYFAGEWKYIPVCRLAVFIEESLYRGTQWIVFEPNDEPFWTLELPFPLLLENTRQRCQCSFETELEMADEPIDCLGPFNKRDNGA